jgi:hypothetical protein
MKKEEFKIEIFKYLIDFLYYEADIIDCCHNFSCNCDTYEELSKKYCLDDLLQIMIDYKKHIEEIRNKVPIYNNGKIILNIDLIDLIIEGASIDYLYSFYKKVDRDQKLKSLLEEKENGKK